MNMKYFTKIPNEIFDSNPVSIAARFLYCILLRRCQNSGQCYPSQATLGKYMNLSTRYIRTLLNELIQFKLVRKVRTGFNRSNTYFVTDSPMFDGQSYSSHSGITVPIHTGVTVPSKNTHRTRNYKKQIRGMKKQLATRLEMEKK